MKEEIEKMYAQALYDDTPPNVFADQVLRLFGVRGSFLADEFHEWIELNDWQFNPVSFNGNIKYRWVNEAYSGQATTKELYEIFLSPK